MIVKKVDLPTACAVCGRTLLLGEKAFRYSSGADEAVDVCALCTDDANVYGWVREGSPTAPLVGEPRVRRRRFPSIPAFLESRRHEGEPARDEPMLRRLTETEQAMIHGAEVFNASPFRRTVAGIAKSLGDPRVSFLLLSGTNPEVVLTVAWDLSWYQYRIVLGGSQEQVRLAERGYEIVDLDARFQAWNGSLDPTGAVTPDIPRF